jgi:DNA-binding response OmpR family regulator
MLERQDHHTVSALAIGQFGTDRLLLHDIFLKAGWRLFEARDRRHAMRFLEQTPVHVVIAESDVPNWGWKKVLSDLRRLPQPPQLIVTSTTADDYLWSEVLNIGGYDVLPQPLEREEAERVIAAARRQYNVPERRTATSEFAPAMINVA